MRYLLVAAILASVIGSGSAQAQNPAPARYYSGANSIYGAPGFYGTSYGVASYGVPRTDSEFSSPYGAGSQPGKYGVGLWRPGFTAPGYVYGASTSYRTFPAQTWPSPTAYGPPFGVYAPAFGPPTPPMW